jgi:hypothetical protein
MTDLYLTQSEINTFLRCRRKWWLSVYRRLRIKTVLPYGALMLGTHVHDALAGKYEKGLDPLVVFDNIYATLMAGLPEEQVWHAERINKDFELGRIMIEGYLDWIAETGVDAHMEVTSVEQKVDVAFRPGVRLLGKLDVRIVDQYGARRFMDHKTVGSLTEPLKTLHMDVQMKHYHLLEFMLAVEEGLDPTSNVLCAGGLYNMLRKVKRTAKATPPFYDRVNQEHNIHEIRKFYLQVYEISSQVLELRRRLDAGTEDPTVIAPPTPRGDCSWSCEWFAVCPMFDDGSGAEQYLGDLTVAHDPLERYNERTDEV